MSQQNNTINILKEIKTIIEAEKNKNPENISLHDVWTVSNNRKKELQKIQEPYQEKILQAIHEQISEYAYAKLYSFNYYKNELTLFFQWCELRGTITFRKKDGKMYIKNADCPIPEKLFSAIEDILSELYDKYIKYSTLKNQDKHCIKPVNSQFNVNITQSHIKVKVLNPFHIMYPDFYLSQKITDGSYTYYCNSNEVLNIIKDNETEILKRLFIKINDCPEWMQQELYEIRKQQLQQEKPTLKTKILSIFK